MTTSYVSEIVQITRRMAALESEVFDLVGQARRPLEIQWQALMNERGALVATAMRNGVEADTITWAIDMQSPINRAMLDLASAVLRIAALEGNDVAVEALRGAADAAAGIA